MPWLNSANYIPTDLLRFWSADGPTTLVAGPVAGTAAFRTLAGSGFYGVSFWQESSVHGIAAEAAAYQGDWTYEGFVYINAAAMHILFAAGGWANGATEPVNVTAMVTIKATNRLSTSWERGAGIVVSPSADSTVNIPTLQWVHVAVVKDSAAKTLAYYVNGALNGTATFAFNPTGGDSATAFDCRTSIGGYVNFGHTSNFNTAAVTFSTTKRDAAWMAASHAHLSTDGILPTDGSTWINANAILQSELENHVNGPTMSSVFVDDIDPDIKGPTVEVASPGVGSAIDTADPIILEVMDEQSNVTTVDSIEIKIAGAYVEIYDGAAFSADYDGNSEVVNNGDGTFSISIEADAGWPATVRAVRVTATDARGNQAVREVGSWLLEDAAPPAITVVSPTPGVARGEPGGFPVGDTAAKATPIILEIEDDTSVVYIAVFASFAGASRVPVFRRGAFESGFSSYSWIEAIDATTTRLHVRRDAGWPLAPITFTADVVDGAGNLD